MTRATKRQTQTFSFHVPSNRELFRTAVWTATFSDKGLCKLSVTEGKRGTPKTTARDPRLSELKAVLQKRLAGRDVNLDFDAFDLDSAPAFNLRVWKAMHAIPFGETRTYGEVAIDAGSPLGARPCGQACGSNRIILLIPCHRVVSSSGIGGFGCGLHWKRALMALEGIRY
jgi:methylated-DNA-[protein]-cysteine S-methyltransferase